MNKSDCSASLANKRILNFPQWFDEYVYTGYRNLPYDSFRWIRKNRDRKFFLWLPIGTLHYPFALHGEYEDKDKFDPKNYKGIFKNHEFIDFDVILYIYKNRLYFADKKKSISLSLEDRAYIVSRYDYGIFYLDQFIRDLISELKIQKIFHNTVFIIHGFHGIALGEHGNFTVYDIYDTETNSALIIHHPKARFKKPLRIANQVRGIDLMPSVLDILGVKIPSGVEGRSVFKYPEVVDEVNREAYIERTQIYEYEIVKNFSFIPQKYKEDINDVFKQTGLKHDIAIRTNSWKLIHRRVREAEKKIGWWKHVSGLEFSRKEYELFDLLKDPYEQNNVIELYPEISRDLKHKLEVWESRNRNKLR